MSDAPPPAEEQPKVAPSIAFDRNGVRLWHGHCLDVLRGMETASVDSIVTDPPAGIKFMGKSWDANKGGRNAWIAWLSSIMRECLRVLKPGGHAVVWALPRTSHWTGFAIEDAGFEVRDKITHIFGSGYPKSLDVSKAIDKAGGTPTEEQARALREQRERKGFTREQVADVIGCTVSSIRDWEEGRARKRGGAIEWVVPSAKYREHLTALIGYTDDARVVTGTVSDRRGDGTVIGLGHSGTLMEGGNTEASEQWAGWGTGLKPAAEDWWLARKPLEGTVVANVQKYGTGALNIDDCRIEFANDADKAEASAKNQHVKIGSGPRTNNIFGDDKTMRPDYDATARWPANLVLDDVAAAMLDAQSGITTSGAMRREVDAYEGQSNTSFLRGRSGPSNQHGDTGGASRFFAIFQRTMEEDDLRFFYTAKASKSERGDDNTHPTVKPVALMAWLCRLVTPPGGIVLDPFCGSGSTLLAAIEEGFRPTGIELESEYVEIIIKRLERALAQGNLFRNP